jgi:flagellar biosynthesis/type III secretory pathway protein FliH
VSFGTLPRLVAFGSASSLSGEVQAIVDSAAAEAYERGRQAGIEEGVAAAARRAEALAAPVADALRAGVAELRGLREARHAELLEMAVEIARAATGHEMAPAGGRLLEDVRAALQAVDDTHLVVTAHPDDCEILQAGLASSLGSSQGVSVVPDAGLQPGEARVRGPWALVDVTADATWAAIREALGLPDRR